MTEASAPELRERLAFGALSASIYAVAADRSLAVGDLSALYLVAPVLAVVAVGQSSGSEAFIRAGISLLALGAPILLVSALRGHDTPNVFSPTLLLSVGSGVFALNLALIALASAILKRLWPQSDHWTR